MKRDKYYNLINIGSDEEIKIKDLAFLIKKITNYKGKIIFNKKMPDGVKQKKLDITKLKKLGWKQKTSLKEGIQIVINEISKKFNYN